MRAHLASTECKLREHRGLAYGDTEEEGCRLPSPVPFLPVAQGERDSAPRGGQTAAFHVHRELWQVWLWLGAVQTKARKSPIFSLFGVWGVTPWFKRGLA